MLEAIGCIAGALCGGHGILPSTKIGAIWESRGHVDANLRWDTSAVRAIMVLLAVNITPIYDVIVLSLTPVEIHGCVGAGVAW